MREERKEDLFSTQAHFHHPNAESGPRSGPMQDPEHHQPRGRSKFTLFISGSDRDAKEYYYERVQNEDERIAKRITAIFIIGAILNTYLYFYLKAKRTANYASQFRDVEQTKALIYIDRQAVDEMNLTHKDLVEMA